MRLVGLYREKECSPGRHLSNDALLLEAVADRLSRRGCDVEIGQLAADAPPPGDALVFSMCQGPAALTTLLGWERDGVAIVNRPQAALNTYRDRLPTVMAAAGIAFPETRLISTNGDDPRGAHARAWPPPDRGFWLKRGDVHASVSRDVQWIDSRAALEAGCAEFHARGIAAAAVQAHREGDEIKFYGVAGGGFFHWFHSSGAPRYAVDGDALQRLAARAAEACGLEIFGGDVIVAQSGALTLIDLNDWPSFAPCRDAAAEAIADYLARRLHAAWNPGVVSSANQGAL